MTDCFGNKTKYVSKDKFRTFRKHRNGADDVQNKPEKSENKLYSKVLLIISGLPVFSGVSAVDPE